MPEELRQHLTQLGVRQITAHFDGCGDSGQFEEVTAEPDTVTLDGDLVEQLEDFLAEQLPGGWEINEGSFGQFEVDVSTGEVTGDAYRRVAQESEAQVTRWKWRQ